MKDAFRNHNTTITSNTKVPMYGQPIMRRKILKPKVNLNFKNTRKHVAIGKTGISKEISITIERPNSSIHQLKLEDANNPRIDHLDSAIPENEIVLKPNENEPAEVKAITGRKFLKPKVNLKTDIRNIIDNESQLSGEPIITEIPSTSDIEFVLEHETISNLREPIEEESIVTQKFLKSVNLNFKNIDRNLAVGKSNISEEISITEKSQNFTTKIESISSNNVNESADRQKATKKIRISSNVRIFPPIKLNKIAQTNSKTANNATIPNGDVMFNEAQFNSNELLQRRSSTIIFPPYKRCMHPDNPASSPKLSKIYRSQIEAIPNLCIEKTSSSASGSEDETREYGRNNNNLVCSVISTSTHLKPARNMMLPNKLTETKQLEKLAVTKRNFQKTFGAKNCEKQKFRMVDLIYYNPEANPMSREKLKDNNSETNKINDEKQIDVPIERENGNHTDDIPGPQIRISASGEIILDEISLVIENAELAKKIKEISNSPVIVDGDLNKTYGVYNRAKRAPNWTKKETSKFYKALNLIGTDFATMTDLFPKRTRTQLKAKFKREEKTNLHLIDKVLREPCTFSYSDFKRELHVEEEEEAVLRRIRYEENERRKQRKVENLKQKDIYYEKKIKCKETLENPNKIPIPETKPYKFNDREKKPITIFSVLDSDED